MTYDGSKLVLYVNGEQVSSLAYNGVPTSVEVAYLGGGRMTPDSSRA